MRSLRISLNRCASLLPARQLATVRFWLKRRRNPEKFSGFDRAPSTPNRRTSITPTRILGYLGAYRLEVPIHGPSEIPEDSSGISRTGRYYGPAVGSFAVAYWTHLHSLAEGYACLVVVARRPGTRCEGRAPNGWSLMGNVPTLRSVYRRLARSRLGDAAMFAGCLVRRCDQQMQVAVQHARLHHGP